MKLVDYLVDDYRKTGSVGSGIPLQPALDEDTFRIVRRRLLQTTVRKAYSNTAFYSRIAKSMNIDARGDFRLESLPVTRKEDLRGKERDFIDAESKGPILSFSSTSTTGFPPTRVWMGRREMELLAATNAFNLISNARLLPDDILLSAVSSRATLSNWVTVEACKRIGASMIHTGTIDPDECLRYLSTDYGIRGKRKKPTRLTTYPSYLEVLCDTAKKNGYAESDFALKSIYLVGEVLTSCAVDRSRELFNADVSESYNISECIQMRGGVCPNGNLHFAANGEVEVLHPESLEPVSDGGLGVLTFTPYSPPREVTLLVRYATGDVDRKVGECRCGLQNTSVVSRPLGKRSQLLASSGLTYRDLFELLEEVEGVSHPLRVGCQRGAGGELVVHVAVEANYYHRASEDILNRLAKNGVAAVVVTHGRTDSFEHYPLRSELIEPALSAIRAMREAVVSAM